MRRIGMGSVIGPTPGTVIKRRHGAMVWAKHPHPHIQPGNLGAQRTPRQKQRVYDLGHRRRIGDQL